MSYLVMARKYRPETFEEVGGQGHVVRTLQNAIESDRIGHAYLFCGPRGVGKTTVARLFARALNSNFEGSLEASLAIREIDGASHNSVDHVRELVETFRTLPPPGVQYKVYIIDEVHMLSTSAFNALLKSLEEPPPHTVFILATTEPHKIPMTVISRCQRFDFRALSISSIIEKLQKICSLEDIDADRGSLRIIARLADGSMRDAESLLDRVIAYSDSALSSSIVAEALGVVGQDLLQRVVAAITRGESREAFGLLDEILDTGCDIGIFLRDFVELWRDLLLLKAAGEEHLVERGEYDEQGLSSLHEIVREVSTEDVIDLCQLAREGADRVLRSSYPRAAIEALIVRLASREPLRALADIVNDFMQYQRGAQSATPRKSVSAQATEVDTSPTTQGFETGKKTLAPLLSPSVGKEASWADFVLVVERGGHRLLAEHLKRAVALSFDAREVTLSGASFVVEYLQRPEVVSKMSPLLHTFLGSEPQIQVVESSQSETLEVQSMHEAEASSQKRRREELLAGVLKEPAVQAIKKAFPGSEIEKIVVKKKKLKTDVGHQKGK